jgi:LacI family transcriptional regulator
VGWPLSSETGRDRQTGWRQACERLGLEDDLHVAVADDFEQARGAAHRLLDAGEPVTAITCASDTLALGVLRALADRGLRAGADVAVTGFDNSPAAALTTPGLTSLRQPLEQIAQELVTAVESLLAGTPQRRQTLLQPELVVRESSLRGPAHTPPPIEETP